MSQLDADDRRLMIEAVKEGVQAGLGGNKTYNYNTPPSGGGGGGGGGQSIFTTEALGKLGNFAGKVGEGLGGLKGQLDQSVDGFQQLSRTGMSFNNNAIGMRDSIAQTRLSLDEYKQVMEKLSPSIAGLGGTAAQGAANFNKFSSQFMQTDFAEQLTKMGYTTKDLNDVMAANMANRRFTDLSDDLQRKKAIESTAELARQMDETAKLTGISRQEQMADMKARSENGKVQAAIQLEMIKGGKDVEQNYNNMQQSLNGLGKGVKDLADEMFTGGVRTEEGAAKMAALGPAGIELQKAVEASKKAKTDEEKAAAEAQLNRAKAAVNERMKSEEFLNAVMVAGGKVGPAMQKMYEENKLRAGTTATEAKTGQTTGQAMATNQAAAVNQQQGRDEKGAKDEGAKSTELYIQVLNRSKDVQAMVASGANKMNDALMKIPETAKVVDNALAATRSRVKNEKGEEVPLAQGGLQGFLDRANKAFPKGEKETGPTGPTGQPIPGPVGPGRSPLEIARDKIQGAISILNWADNSMPGSVIVKSILSGSMPTNTASQAEGSKDTFGSWFGKDWGKGGLSMLHGKEAVVPEGKVGEFMQDMMQKANVSNFKPKEAEGGKETVSLTMEQIDGLTKAMKQMSPEALLDMAATGQGQQAEIAAKLVTEMTVAEKKAKAEEKKVEEKKPAGPVVDTEFGDLKGAMQKVKEASAKTAAPKDSPITEIQKKLVEAGAKIKVDGKMGPETMAAIKANMASMVRDTAKKQEVSAPATAPAESPKTDTKAAKAGTEATLSDVVKSLDSLNTLMTQLTAHAAETAEHSGNAVKATKGLNGNLFAR